MDAPKKPQDEKEQKSQQSPTNSQAADNASNKNGLDPDQLHQALAELEVREAPAPAQPPLDPLLPLTLRNTLRQLGSEWLRLVDVFGGPIGFYGRIRAPNWRWSEATFDNLDKLNANDFTHMLGCRHPRRVMHLIFNQQTMSQDNPLWQPERLAQRLGWATAANVPDAIRRITRGHVLADMQLTALEDEHSSLTKDWRKKLENITAANELNLRIPPLRADAQADAARIDHQLPEVNLTRPESRATDGERSDEPFFVVPELLPLPLDQYREWRSGLPDQHRRRSRTTSTPNPFSRLPDSDSTGDFIRKNNHCTWCGQSTSSQPSTSSIVSPLSSTTTTTTTTATTSLKPPYAADTNSPPTADAPTEYACLYPNCGETCAELDRMRTHVHAKHYLVNGEHNLSRAAYLDLAREKWYWLPVPFPDPDLYVAIGPVDETTATTTTATITATPSKANTFSKQQRR